MTDTGAGLFDAIDLATRAHAGQYRKGSRVPYILHPLRVAALLIDAGAPEPVPIAGVLHDTVEDTSVDLHEIADRFGDAVATLVAGVTEPDRSAAWEARKTHTVEALARAPDGVLWIACADKLDNVRSMARGQQRLGGDFWRRFSRPREQQAWYYRGVLSALRARRPDAGLATLVNDLDRQIDRLFGDAAPVTVGA